MLTAQKKLFADEYLRLRCKNQAQAAINAGYSPKSAPAQSSRLVKDCEVLEYLEQEKSALQRELRQEFIFDALQARKVMHGILENAESEDRDRIAVAKDFLDRAGFKPPEKVEVSGELNNPFKNLTTEQLVRLAGEDSD